MPTTVEKWGYLEIRLTAHFSGNPFQIIEAEDPYHHLRSIHNCHGFYNHRNLGHTLQRSAS